MSGKRKLSKKTEEPASDEVKIDLGKKKQVTVRKYNGVKLVDIREYYTDTSGDVKPGKKGISLTQESWDLLVANMDKIQAALGGMDENQAAKKAKKEVESGEEDAELKELLDSVKGG